MMDDKKFFRINSVDIERVYGQSTYTPIRATINCDMMPSFLNGCKSFQDISEKIEKMISNGADIGKMLSNKSYYIPKKILKSGPCTIVFWQDGTKTIVRRAADEVDDDYSAFTAALAIKIFGSNSAVKRTVKNKLVEKIKKPKKRKAATKEEMAEHGKWLFDRIMTYSGTAWTCPKCNIKVPYEIVDNEVVAVCPNCGLSQKLSVE